MLRRNLLELCLIEFIRTLNIVENLEYVLNKHCRRFFTNIVKKYSWFNQSANRNILVVTG